MRRSICGEPHLAERLAATDYTHLIVRMSGAARVGPVATAAAPGWRVAAAFDDSQVFAVATDAPLIYTAAMTGFSPREYESTRSWRWMGNDAAWTIINTGARPVHDLVISKISVDEGHARHRFSRPSATSAASITTRRNESS